MILRNYRWTYNKCLDGIMNHGVPRNKSTLRAYCVNSDATVELPPWVLDVPYDIRDEAMNDVIKVCAIARTQVEPS
jgi:hypothetical protein